MDMKKFILIFMFSLSLMAQENVVKINTLSLMVNTLSAFYERKLTDIHTAQLGFYFLSNFNQTNDGSGSSDKLTGFGITPEFRYYFKEAFKDYYIAPFIRFQSWTFIETTMMDDPSTPQVDEKLVTFRGVINYFGGGVVIGQQTIIADKLVVDYFAGPAYYLTKVKSKDPNAANNYSGPLFDGFTIRFGACIGFAF